MSELDDFEDKDDFEEPFVTHLNKYLGERNGVLHERGTFGRHHLDCYLYPPSTPHRDFWSVITHGMSNIPMHNPLPEMQYCELMIMLNPKEWNLNMTDAFMGRPLISDYPVATKDFLKDSSLNWPISNMLKLVSFPEMFRTWIAHGHTIDVEGYEIGRYYGWLIKTPESLDRNFSTVKIQNKLIKIYALIPIFRSELFLAQRSGTEKLFSVLKKREIPEIISQRRKNVV